MSMRKRLGSALVVALGASMAIILYGSVGREARQQPVNVTLIQLIAIPEKYDGKLVTVAGYLSYGGPDGDALSLSKDDYENGVGDGIPVARTKQMWKAREKLYDMYVAMTGVFHAENGPETELPHPAGRITEVQRCNFISDPNHPMAERLKGLPGVQVGPPR